MRTPCTPLHPIAYHCILRTHLREHATAGKTHRLERLSRMERHTEIVRQWRLLLALEGRSRGLTLNEAQIEAGDGVSDRTIRRDFEALTQAGFPIETTKRDGKTAFALNRDVFKGVAAAGFSLSELCALHLSRTVLTAVAGGPFRESLASAFDKLYDALPPPMWKFIESLPDALGAKEHATRPRGAASAKSVDALMQAILGRRRVRMRYHSFSSQQVKDYIVEPYRLAYAQGGLYLQAFVPDYSEMRTFAVQRIEQAVALEESFNPVESAGSDAGRSRCHRRLQREAPRTLSRSWCPREAAARPELADT